MPEDPAVRSVAQVRTWLRTSHGTKLLRFTMTSVLSTVISEATILIIYGFSWTHSPMWASAIGNVVAMPPAYRLTRRWAWGKTGASHWRTEVTPFVALNVLGLGVSLLGATYCRHIVYSHHLSHLLNTVLVGGVNLLSFAVFWVFKVLLFNRIFETTTVASLDDRVVNHEPTA